MRLPKVTIWVEGMGWGRPFPWPLTDEKASQFVALSQPLSLLNIPTSCPFSQQYLPPSFRRRNDHKRISFIAAIHF